MKGLDLAEAFYREQGAAMLAEQVPACCSRIAAGMVGPGSECFGFDDRWSRDHDWGPGFCLWLSEEDHQSVGKELQRAYKRLPDRFMGFGPRKTSPGEAWRVGVIRTRDFFTRLTGLDHPPESIAEWLRIPEHALAACVNGRVFTDPLGDVTGWRQAISIYYPDDIRLKKIASRCITLAQSGQYNFPPRPSARSAFCRRCRPHSILYGYDFSGLSAELPLHALFQMDPPGRGGPADFGGDGARPGRPASGLAGTEGAGRYHGRPFGTGHPGAPEPEAVERIQRFSSGSRRCGS
jgi:hypothetical protein